ncbi:MAG: methyltransferase domain-containing protein [Chloroflexi bacterium]|nr:methyltransferase domain-containing protein [Chloroflexota bacterium]
MPEAPTTPSREQVALGNPSFVWRAGQDRRLDLIRRYVTLEGARVLDIGCGIGTYVRKLGELTERAYGIDIDAARVRESKSGGVAIAASEQLPFATGALDVVLLNEVIEHVQRESETLREACRVVRPGGHVVIYAPNRLYPFETHGVYIGRRYFFGNVPLVNYLPDSLRQRLVPHARAYTSRGLRRLIAGLPAKLIVHTQIYPGFDQIEARRPRLGAVLRAVFHRLERTPLRAFGLSHFLVLQTEAANDG